MKRICRLLVVAGLFAGLANSVWSFDLSPKGTRFDRDAVKAWAPSFLDGVLTALTDKGLPKFKHSVHEEITHRAYECNHEGPIICGDPDAQFATPYVIAGVRWNDDPPFQMSPNQAGDTSCKTAYSDGRPMTIRFITQPRCWAELFLSAEKQIKADANKRFDVANQSALPLRSHFGDLQFIHSMASVDGEDPAETRDKILGWAELTWGVVRENNKLETWLKDINVPVALKFFGNSGWRVQELFTLGDPSLRLYVSDVAFGSLLHTVEDSFAAGHVDRMEPANGAQCSGSPYRAPGPIREFHSYTHQSTSGHAGADTRDAFINNRLTPDVVDVGRTLVALRKDKADWTKVKAYLMCVYDFAPEIRKASAGQF
ncbi:MAG: hypothetical protein A2045_09060 [Rhodocyclales bacterium GWA2_65_20]|nr:MAG: hypothetical protein A2045_09060 [Rhodocyclales bacterium GWA2_65_20]